MLGHAKNLYEMYRFGKSAVNSKIFEKSLNKAKKNYQQKRKKQEKRLKRTKAGRRQLKEMKARQKATKQLWDGVTKMVQPLGKVLTSARKLANNLTKAELVKSVKKDMKKKVIQKQNCTLPVYVQADKRMVASVSLQESVDAFTIFLRKYPTAKEAKAALPTMSKYKGTYVYKQVEEAIRNGRYKGLVHFEEFMRVNGGHDPLFPRRGSGLTKNQTSNQLNVNPNGNKPNSSSQGANGLKYIYDSIKKAPQYPKGFRGVQNGTKKINIKNKDVLDELRKVEPGQWKKVYKDGYDANGKKISIHYFESSTNKVFNVKVKSGWSNK